MRTELIDVRDDEPVGRLPEDERQWFEEPRRAVPGEQIRPLVERRLKDVRVSRPDSALRAVGRHDEIRIRELRLIVASPLELEGHTDLAAMVVQRAQQVDPRHAMERIAGKRDVLPLCTTAMSSNTTWPRVIDS